jgi:pimeloyl-ACP methyl ester carboxylesterase
MKTQAVSFYSDGIRLEGLLQRPDGAAAPGRGPAIVLCSGYQGVKELIPSRFWGPLTSAGYTCFAFDYRGFGASGGERGRLLPAEQVADVRHAVTFLQQHPGVESARVGLLGWGLGGGIAVQAAAEDPRVAAVACLNGVGDAGRAVRDSRPYAEWLAMQDRIADDRRRRVLTGHSELAGPWEVVPLDPATRAVVDAEMSGRYEGFGVEISLVSAEAYYAFRPERAVHRISPRPLLIVHGARNALHPIREARSLYGRAKAPKELIEIAGGEHLNWLEPGSPLREATMPRILAWWRRHLPVAEPVGAGR